MKQVGAYISLATGVVRTLQGHESHLTPQSLAYSNYGHTLLNVEPLVCIVTLSPSLLRHLKPWFASAL